jgi:hypothetical protein
MTSLWQSPAIVVVFITWLTAPTSNLGEAARREALRRQLARPAVASLTNLGQPREIVAADETTDPVPATPARPPAGVDDEGVPLPPGSPAPAPAKPAAAPAAQNAQPAAAPAAKGDEKSWRDRMTTAREALERDQVLADGMQSRINGLQTDVVNRDDPAQQSQLRQQLARALAELERLKKQIDADRKAIVDIQADARRLGVPPGWVR